MGHGIPVLPYDIYAGEHAHGWYLSHDCLGNRPHFLICATHSTVVGVTAIFLSFSLLYYQVFCTTKFFVFSNLEFSFLASLHNMYSHYIYDQMFNNSTSNIFKNYLGVS